MKGQQGLGTPRAFLFLITAISLALSSCATTPLGKELPPESRHATIARISAMAVTDPEAALADFSKFPEIQAEEALIGAAVDSLISAYTSALTQGNWNSAERLFTSIRAVGLMEGSAFQASKELVAKASGENGLQTILRGKAEGYLGKGVLAPALYYHGLSAALQDGKGLTNEELDALEDRAYRKETSPGQEGRIQAALEGVVTVYVDKGLKIQGGRGYPDRVVGSAFQVDPQGYYITSYHVVASEVDPSYEGYSKLSIRPSGNPEARVPAKVVGWNKELDLALLKSQEASAYTFRLHAGPSLAKGEKVFALGSPIGLENSVSSGIVSASGRRILAKGEALQIDVPVNPGNSGGPLIDAGGALVGIVFAGLSEFQGLNFALPLEWLVPFGLRLFEGGGQPMPWLGVSAAKTLDGRLQIVYAYPGKSPLKTGDTLLSIDGIDVSDLNSAQMAVAAKPLDSLACVKIDRNGDVATLLIRRSAQPDTPFEAAIALDSMENLVAGLLGVEIQHISGPRGGGGTYKVEKAWPGQVGDESGLGAGDVIKFARIHFDAKLGAAFIDYVQKSPTKGYLEKTVRVGASLDSPNFL